jgi:hypothetical protein
MRRGRCTVADIEDILVIAAIIAVAVLFGLEAKRREKAWKEGNFEDACPPPQI